MILLSLPFILLFIFYVVMKEKFFYKKKRVFFQGLFIEIPIWWKVEENGFSTSSWNLICKKTLKESLKDWELDDPLFSQKMIGKGTFLGERKHLFLMNKDKFFLMSMSSVFEAGLEDYYVEKIFKDLKF